MTEPRKCALCGVKVITVRAETWQERKSYRAWKKAEKQEARVKTRQTSIKDAARYKRYAEEIKKKLEGAA